MSDKADQLAEKVATQAQGELTAVTFDISALVMMILTALIDRLEVCPMSADRLQARLRKNSFWVRDAKRKAAREARQEYGAGTDGLPLDVRQVSQVADMAVKQAADSDPAEWQEMLAEVRTNRVNHRLR